MTQTVRVVVNGHERHLPPGATVADAVAAAGGDGGRRVAVARNAEVVPRATWSTTPVRDGDRIEVVAPIQGG